MYAGMTQQIHNTPAIPIHQDNSSVPYVTGVNNRIRKLFPEDKQSLGKNSLTYNCRFMTHNVWLQLSKSANFIGNYENAEPITYRNCFIPKMYLLLLLYAAWHTIISPSKIQRLHLLLPLFITKLILNLKN